MSVIRFCSPDWRQNEMVKRMDNDMQEKQYKTNRFRLGQSVPKDNGYLLFLASASPRRRELLAQIGLTYQVVASDVEEKTKSHKPWEMVEELSGLKAGAVFDRLLEEKSGKTMPVEPFVVIGADTVVALGEQIMGKPKDEQDAVRMLSLLQGRTHQVYTGVTLVYTKEEGKICRTSFHEKTDVAMYPVSQEEIYAYVATGEPMDKAGAYGIQGRCAAFIKGISGDYNNVVGLPVGRLYQELCRL